MRNWLACLLLILVCVLGWSPPAQAQYPFSVSGTITTNSSDCSTAGSCVSIPGPWAPTFATVGVDLSGTWTGTCSFEGTIDGATWRAVAANPVAGGSAVTTTTAGGGWQVQAAGLVAFRVRGSATMTGTVIVKLQASQSALMIGGGGGGSGTVSSGTTGYIPQYTAATTVGNSNPVLDNGITAANRLSYAGSQGIDAIAGPLISGLPAGGVGSSIFLQQEGTVPGSLSASGQDNCYADSTQHGLLCNFNAGTTLPLVQGPASSTSGHIAAFNVTNGGRLADSGVSAASGTLTATLYATATKCAAAGSGANPSLVACSAAPAGFFSCATNASTGTCVVSTTAVTANSVIQIQPDSTLGTALSVTCNTTADSGLTAPRVSARSANTSFTITLGTFSTNPECFSYIIIN